MTPFEKMQKIESIKTYYNGLRDGIQMYAHWKDGTQYVGTTGKTFRTAVMELNREEEQRISELQEKV
jgi:hypothetical protein